MEPPSKVRDYCNVNGLTHPRIVWVLGIERALATDGNGGVVLIPDYVHRKVLEVAYG